MNPAETPEDQTNPPFCSIIDFGKFDIRVATVLEETPHPKADRLLVLKVDLGDGDIRQIVAGIKNYYSGQMVDKQIIVVTNLEPATIRGVESRGMLLAASSPDKAFLSLLTVDKIIPRGTKVG